MRSLQVSRFTHVVRRILDDAERRILEGGPPARGSLEGADLCIEIGPDLQLPFALDDIEGDRHPLYRDDLTDELRHIGHRSALLARVDAEDCLLLLGRRLVIDKRDNSPIAR